MKTRSFRSTDLARMGACLLAILASSAAVSRADEFDDKQSGLVNLPLWEVGLFSGVARLPHYLGSDEYKLYVLPLPYLIYRGEFLKVDRDGFKGILFENDQIESGMSVSGNPPVDEDNEAREGMPELEAILEAGPLLKYYLNERHARNPLYISLSARAVIAVDPGPIDMTHEGFKSGLGLTYRNHTWLEEQRISFGLRTTVEFADQECNSYFYDVESAYANASRPAYKSGGGYANFSISATTSKRLSNNWALGSYYRWDSVAGAVFRDSPLVKAENNHIIGVAVIWNIHRSRTRIDR